LLVITFVAALTWAPAAPAADVSRAEFFADTKAYLPPFTAAAEKIKALIAAEEYEVVAVAEFTDMQGQPLHVGRIYAEEISALLVGRGRQYRMMDPAAIAESVTASGGASLWSSTKKIKDFGSDSGVELVVTGKIDIASAEARVFLKAVETKEASIAWAQTLNIPGRAATAKP
jgi:TolB-like protein